MSEKQKVPRPTGTEHFNAILIEIISAAKVMILFRNANQNENKL